MKSSDGGAVLRRSDLKPFIVRARFGSFWKYAGKRTRMEQLGAGSVQSATWTYKRGSAKRFTTRSQALLWCRYYARYLHQVEICGVPVGPLQDRTDDLWTQRRLFE